MATGSWPVQMKHLTILFKDARQKKNATLGWLLKLWTMQYWVDSFWLQRRRAHIVWNSEMVPERHPASLQCTQPLRGDSENWFLKDAEERCRDGVGFVDTKWQITMHLLKVFISWLMDGVERCRSRRQPLSFFISVIRKPIFPPVSLARPLSLNSLHLLVYASASALLSSPGRVWL